MERVVMEGKTMNSWRGCRRIEMEWNGTQSDPSLVYKGYRFNYWDIEDALWADFIEERGYKDSDSGDAKVEEEFCGYVQERAEGYLDDTIYGGYFREGSKDWRDSFSKKC
ncbi:MAG: hypothetical protein IIY21_22090 [Clostridiales bacterium]|nr:hypothetical protein [Clostridiales bacterium]